MDGEGIPMDLEGECLLGVSIHLAREWGRGLSDRRLTALSWEWGHLGQRSSDQRYRGTSAGCSDSDTNTLVFPVPLLMFHHICLSCVPVDVLENLGSAPLFIINANI